MEPCVKHRNAPSPDSAIFDAATWIGSGLFNIYMLVFYAGR
jgi:hypothetical protein